ncbi:MAG: alpha/beta hydrolase [Pseudolabrys sp.]|nr:alpha/beta hydrolase [Pseudolabrys sp.]MBV9956754.1 alpha/beta hydrolase [Pseudolabrys sp.]
MASSKTFVLVHGAWHGGWGWVRVVDRLRARGHLVFAPTNTGLGERAHLLTPQVNASLHIADIVNLINHEDLTDIILVGHSYGGCVISGVIEQVPDKIRALVFVDAFIPDNGQSVLDMVQPAVADVIRAAQTRGETTVPVRDAAAFNVNVKDRAWVDRLANPQPIGTMTEKLKLTGARNRVPCIYVRAAGYPNVAFDAALARARREGWRTYEVPGGHDIMINEPERLTEILLGVT